MVHAFKAATTTIPIVMNSTDPVAAGLVASLARPGGNITGASGDPGRSDLNAKRIQIIKEVIPSTKRLGYLAPKGAWDLGAFGDVEREAQKAGLELLGLPLEGLIHEPEYRRVITAMVSSQVDILFVYEATENLVNAKLIVGLTDQYRLPAIYPYREHIEFGGLMGYVVDFRPVARQMAVAADLILKGANPGDIPIHLPAQIEFLINSKTVRVLGLSIPRHLLAAADEVLE
jgi:putative tryptophan/tyrosine transport system substrate-binding protein